MNNNEPNNHIDYISNINFDEAREAWKQNKKSIGNGMYKYICQSVTTNKKVCCKKLVKFVFIQKKRLYNPDVNILELNVE